MREQQWLARAGMREIHQALGGSKQEPSEEQARQVVSREECHVCASEVVPEDEWIFENEDEDHGDMGFQEAEDFLGPCSL